MLEYWLTTDPRRAIASLGKSLMCPEVHGGQICTEHVMAVNMFVRYLSKKRAFRARSNAQPHTTV